LRVLVTGLSGFAGGHLVDDVLANTDWEVWGTAFGTPSHAVQEDPRVHAIPADLLQRGVTDHVLDASQPDVVVHLAGQSSVRDAWAAPWATFETNVRIQLELMQGLSARGLRTRFLAVSSNEVYGAGAVCHGALAEAAPMAPVNPYALSKVAQDMLAEIYGQAHDLEVIRVRPFTHIGPRQSDAFVTSSFARQVAEIEAGLRQPVLRAGNLDAERDFSDVRDIVQGYRVIAASGRSGEAYNLGSGVARSIRSVLEWFLAASAVPIDVRRDPDRERPVDVMLTLCDASKAQQQLGWAPRIPFEQTLSDILDYWRAQVAAHRG
jgi:GDP-4-dehydro-6-deoxy-D-mannose reductase